MGQSFFNDRWKERVKSLYKLPFTNHALKFFPPNFVLRDPVTSLVQRSHRKDISCGLMVFCLEQHDQYGWGGPHFWKEPDKSIQGIFIQVLADYFEKDRILGIKRFGDEDYTVVFQIGKGQSYEEMNRLSIEIAGKLEARMLAYLANKWNGRLTLQTAAYRIENNWSRTNEAIHTAYRYAYALATKKLPPHFNSYRQLLTEILHKAQVSVVTQPIMNLANGEICGWEVLTRGPEATPFHSPANLFDFAHQTNLLTALEFLVIKKAIRVMASEQIGERVFINVTPVTLAHPHLLEQMLGWVKETSSILPNQITLEITERHAIADYEHMASILREYRQHGFRFAVDDAGAGYSSLQTILQLVPDIIKIDESVIRGINTSGVKQSMLRALLYFADDMNCEVIAEGVESEEEANVLFDHRVQMGQGFYFARPEPVRFNYGHSHFADLKEKILRRRELEAALS